MPEENGIAWNLILFEDNKTKIFSQTYFFNSTEKFYDGGEWKPSPTGVNAFIPGDWITDLLELYEMLVAFLKERKIKENYKFKIRNIKKQKKDFGLQ